MNIAICDSEEVYLSSIQKMIDTWKDTQDDLTIQVATFHSSEDLLESIERGVPCDLLLIAIEFQNELNGLEVSRRIRLLNLNIQIVLLCEHIKSALLGYEINALRCLYKPVLPDFLYETLNIASVRIKANQANGIRIHTTDRRIAFVHPQDILYIESSRNLLYIHRLACKEPYITRTSLSYMAELLPNHLLIRCHKSYIVNLNYITCVSYYAVTLVNGQLVPVSRKYRKPFQDTMHIHHWK